MPNFARYIVILVGSITLPQKQKQKQKEDHIPIGGKIPAKVVIFADFHRIYHDNEL